MNLDIFYFLNNFSHQSEIFDKIVIFIAGPFSYFVILFAIIFLLFHHDVLPSKNPWKLFLLKYKEILLVFFSGIFAWVISRILKTLIQAPRPFEMFENVRPLFLHGGMDSFPSGHATFFGALAVSIFMSHKKVGYIFMLFAFMIGMARIISGIHFPVDILGGFIIGAITVLIIKKLRSLS